MFHADSVVDYLGVIVWPLGTITICVATVLLFLADRRLHSLCVMVGFFLLAGSSYGEMFWLSRIHEHGDPHFFESTEEVVVEPVGGGGGGHVSSIIVQVDYFSALELIGMLLLAYGLLMIGIVQFKLSRNPDFRRE